MKVYVKTPPKLSRAMYRVANALERYAPDDFTVVQTEDEADLLVLHVIGLEAIHYRTDKPVAVMQYCTGSGERTAENMAPWLPLWYRAKTVWSYYDLSHFFPQGGFYHAPLGIDHVFRATAPAQARDFMVMTSGYVNGRPQEAIEEPTLAALACGGKTLHLGKTPTGMEFALEFQLLHAPTDSVLASYYRRCKWVAGLRYIEGFEMGVIEGLACGARPVVFNRPDNMHWFDEAAVYVEENCTSEELKEQLVHLFRYEPEPVVSEERQWVLNRFNWKTLVTGFWDRVREAA